MALNARGGEVKCGQSRAVARWESCHAAGCRLVPDAALLAQPTLSCSISLFLSSLTFPDNTDGDPSWHWWMQHSLDAAWTRRSMGYLHMQPKSISLPPLLFTPLFPSLFFGFSWGEPVEKKISHTTPAAQFGTHGLSGNGPSVLALISSACCLWWSLGQAWREIVLSLRPCLLLAVSPLPSGKRAGKDNLGGEGGAAPSPALHCGKNTTAGSVACCSSVLC